MTRGILKPGGWGGRDKRPKPVLSFSLGRLDTLRERFELRVPDKTGECWEWQGPRNEAGYGKFRNARAHRLAYYLATGVDPADMLVCHSCDNPPCVRPAHLFLGTPIDNMVDRDRKGRAICASRSRLLTEEQIAEIRRLFQEGMSTKEIGQRFDVNDSTAWWHARGRTADGRQHKSSWELKGFTSYRQKLTDYQKAEARRRYAIDGVVLVDLATEYGVSLSHMWKIVAGSRSNRNRRKPAA